MEKKMLIDGMMCAHCKATVEKVLSAVEGVEACVVDLAAKTATITLAHDVPDDTLMEAVRARRFTPVRML
ncbi:MAG: heavy metal-associated domain-containing protein [Eubacteriales bacterium]|nr:heavy metal-associated domain-containing protein [Eubacteriales bacterium]